MSNRFVAVVQYRQQESNFVLIDRRLGIESGSLLIGGKRSLCVALRSQGSGPGLDVLQLVGVTGRLLVNRRETGGRRFAGCQHPHEQEKNEAPFCRQNNYPFPFRGQSPSFTINT